MRGIRLAAFLLFALAGALPARAAMKVEEVTGASGVHAWLVEDHTNPIISLSFSFAGGTATDPDGKSGLAGLVADMLDEGAGDLDSQTFQRKLADLAIEMEFSANRDALDGRMKTVTENRDTAFGLLGQALARPRFDDEALERNRRQVLAQLDQELQDPGTVADRKLSEMMFPGHPYGRPEDGTPDSVKALTRTDLADWSRRNLARDRLTVSVVGDITPDQLKTLLDSTFGALPAKADAPAVPDATIAAAGKTEIIRQNYEQSTAVFAEAGIRRDDPDWYAAFVMNYVLGGGGFSSRLMTEVRVKRGLAYSVDSFLAPYDHAALIGGSVGTRNDRMADSLALIRKEWARMAEGGITAAELAAAKTYLNGSFPLEMGSTGAVAGLLTLIQREHLGADYLDRRKTLIDKVTQADVRRVAKRLLRPEALTVVVVGDPKGM